MNEISPFYEDFFFVFFLMFPIKCQRPERKIMKFEKIFIILWKFQCFLKEKQLIFLYIL